LPRIERTDLSTSKRTPAIMKLALLIAVVLGIWGRACHRRSEIENFLFSNITIENQTHISAEIIFDMENNTFQKGKKNILIELFAANDELIASRLTPIDIIPNETRRYVRVVENFNRPLKQDEIIYAKVSLYQRGVATR